MNEPIISARNVCFQYDDSDHPAVDGVSLEIARGEFVAVLGRNGSGKSTFAKLLNALYIPSGGKLLVCGNGGSSADSAHIVGELVKGFLKKRPVDEAMVRATGCDRL